MLPMQVAFWRASLGAVLIVCTLTVVHRRALRVAPRDAPAFALFGVVSIALFYLSHIWAVDLVGVSLAVTLLYTSPVWVALGSWLLFGERLRAQQVIALGIALLGCLLVAQAYDAERLRVNALGVVAGLTAGATYSGYTLFGRLVQHRYSPWTTVAWPVAIGAIVIGGVSASLGVLSAPPPGVWGWLFYLAVGPTVGAMALYLLSLHYLSGELASVVAMAEPVIAVLLSMILLSERLELPQVLGGLLLLPAVLLLQAGGRGRPGTDALYWEEAEQTEETSDEVGSEGNW